MPKRRVKVEALFFEDFPEDSETSFGRTMVDGTAEEWIEFLNKSYYKIISRKDIVGTLKWKKKKSKLVIWFVGAAILDLSDWLKKKIGLILSSTGLRLAKPKETANHDESDWWI